MKSKSMGISLVFLMCAGAQAATAGPLSQSSARAIYKTHLKKVSPSNDGDGVLSKSGAITCSERGRKSPFHYQCGSLSSRTAKDIYLNGLREVQAGNDGDGVLSKEATVVCQERGMRAPFTYQCEFYEN